MHNLTVNLPANSTETPFWPSATRWGLTYTNQPETLDPPVNQTSLAFFNHFQLYSLSGSQPVATFREGFYSIPEAVTALNEAMAAAATYVSLSGYHQWEFVYDSKSSTITFLGRGPSSGADVPVAGYFHFLSNPWLANLLGFGDKKTFIDPNWTTWVVDHLGGRTIEEWTDEFDGWCILYNGYTHTIGGLHTDSLINVSIPGILPESTLIPKGVKTLHSNVCDTRFPYYDKNLANPYYAYSPTPYSGAFQVENYTRAGEILTWRRQNGNENIAGPIAKLGTSITVILTDVNGNLLANPGHWTMVLRIVQNVNGTFVSC
jgi:hypothetical protein